MYKHIYIYIYIHVYIYIYIEREREIHIYTRISAYVPGARDADRLQLRAGDGAPADRDLFICVRISSVISVYVCTCSL